MIEKIKFAKKSRQIDMNFKKNHENLEIATAIFQPRMKDPKWIQSSSIASAKFGIRGKPRGASAGIVPSPTRISMPRPLYLKHSVVKCKND